MKLIDMKIDHFGGRYKCKQLPSLSTPESSEFLSPITKKGAEKYRNKVCYQN